MLSDMVGAGSRHARSMKIAGVNPKPTIVIQPVTDVTGRSAPRTPTARSQTATIAHLKRVNGIMNQA
jgi:hypothetical protein